VKEGETTHETIYGDVDIKNPPERKNGEPRWEPPLPVSVVKEEGCYGEAGVSGEGTYKGEHNLENNMTATQGGQFYNLLYRLRCLILNLHEANIQQRNQLL
jgi:hypothetical protein